MEQDINSPNRFNEIRSKILGKKLVNLWYRDRYQSFMDSITSLGPTHELNVVELGAGGSFLKEYCPNVIYTDVIAYPELDEVLDATNMGLEDSSVDAFFMMNVLHHIPDPKGFFYEAQRCLKPGGQIFITDHYIGPVSYALYRFIHKEPFQDKAGSWSFDSEGPLSDANTALTKLIFYDDREDFDHFFQELKVLELQKHSTFSYWFGGGLKNWTLVPESLASRFIQFDRYFSKVLPWSASFLDIKIEKIIS